MQYARQGTAGVNTDRDGMWHDSIKNHKDADAIARSSSEEMTIAVTITSATMKFKQMMSELECSRGRGECIYAIQH